MNTYQPWWEEFPGRLEQELDALNSLGIRCKLDEEARSRDGVIRVDLVVPDELTGRGELDLKVTYPDSYPFHRPDVVAPALALRHHQHPFGRNLCLIGRGSRWWYSGDTLASLLAEQLKPALVAGDGATGGADVLEEEQGEPFSDYYPYDHDMAVLVDSEWSPQPGESGPAVFGCTGTFVPGGHFVVLASQLRSDRGGSWDLPEQVLALYEGVRECRGTWVMLDAPPVGYDGSELWKAVDAASGVPGGAATTNAPVLRLVGFPEERTMTTSGPGWLLLARVPGAPTSDERRRQRSRNPAKRASATSGRVLVIRAGRAGASDLGARSPHATKLAARRVLLIGTGAIGSVLAEQLARVGVGEITLVDRDVLEPGNLARHACTMRHVGRPKALAVAQLVREAHPYAAVNVMHYALGSAPASAEDRAQLAEYIEKADLVIDATAEVGTQELTAHLARRATRPWLMIEATTGAWGGSVVHIPAESDWCFSCLQWHRNEGGIPWPPGDDATAVQPPGCAEPTFVGAGFDLGEVSLQGARAAVAALSGRPTCSVAVLALRDANGRQILPTWTSHSVGRHAQCHHN